MMSPKQLLLARLSLSFLWIFSALTSSIWAYPTSIEILSNLNISNLTADIMIYGGSLLDFLLGVWVLSGRYHKACCYAQLIVVIVYSLLLTLIAADFWLHPFGPVTKNIPIMVLIWLLANNKMKKQ